MSVDLRTDLIVEYIFRYMMTANQSILDYKF